MRPRQITAASMCCPRTSCASFTCSKVCTNAEMLRGQRGGIKVLVSKTAVWSKCGVHSSYHYACHLHVFSSSPFIVNDMIVSKRLLLQRDRGFQRDLSLSLSLWPRRIVVLPTSFALQVNLPGRQCRTSSLVRIVRNPHVFCSILPVSAFRRRLVDPSRAENDAAARDAHSQCCLRRRASIRL